MSSLSPASYATVPRGTPTIDAEDKTKMSALERRRQQNRIAQRRCREKNQRRKEAEKQAQQQAQREQETPQPPVDSGYHSQRSGSNSSNEDIDSLLSSSMPNASISTLDLQSTHSQSNSPQNVFAPLTAADFELPPTLSHENSMDFSNTFPMMSLPEHKPLSGTDLTSGWMATPPARNSLDLSEPSSYSSTPPSMAPIPDGSGLRYSYSVDSHVTSRSLNSSPAPGAMSSLSHSNSHAASGTQSPQQQRARARQRSASMGPRHSRSSSASTHGNTALHTAVAQGHLGMAQTLLAQGANPSAINSRGQTPLHVAAEAGMATCVRLLIPLYTYIDAKDFLGYTPLQLAVTRANDQVVMMLLESGADINAKIEETTAPSANPNLGGSPLHHHGWTALAGQMHGLRGATMPPSANTMPVAVSMGESAGMAGY